MIQKAILNLSKIVRGLGLKLSRKYFPNVETAFVVHILYLFTRRICMHVLFIHFLVIVGGGIGLD